MSCKTRKLLLFLFAIAATSPALAKEKSSAIDDPFATGIRLASEKKYAQASEKFELAVKEDPTFIAAYVESARALVLAGKRKDGLKRIEAALQIARKKFDLDRLKNQRRLLSEIFYTNATYQRYQDGVNHMQGMKLRAAIEAFEQALATEPDNVEVMIAYARALQAVDDWKESVNVLEQAFALNPDKKEARLLLAKALLSTNQERTIQLLRPLIDDPLESEDVVVTYAQALAKRGQTAEAIAILQRDVDRRTDRLRTLYWLGKYHSDSPDNRWVARKHLHTFLKRSERAEGEDELRGLQQEAKRIVERLDGELEIDTQEENQ